MEKIGSLPGVNLNDYLTRVDNANGQANSQYNIGSVLADSGYNIGTEDSIGAEYAELLKSMDGVKQTELSAGEAPHRKTERERADEKLQEMNAKKLQEIETIEAQCRRFIETGELPDGDVSPKLKNDLKAFLVSDTYSQAHLMNDIELENAGIDKDTDPKIKLTASKNNLKKYIAEDESSLEDIREQRKKLDKKDPDYQKKKNLLDVYEQILNKKIEGNKKLYNATNHDQRDNTYRIGANIIGAGVGALASKHTEGELVTNIYDSITGSNTSTNTGGSASSSYEEESSSYEGESSGETEDGKDV